MNAIVTKPMQIKRTHLFLLGFFTALCCIAFQNCDKRHAKKLSGIYDCQVHLVSLTGAIYTIDTSYTEELQVTREKKELIVLGHRVHIDSLWKDKEYSEGCCYNYFTLKFTGDSLLLRTASGGQGGYGEYTYRGKKRK